MRFRLIDQIIRLCAADHGEIVIELISHGEIAQSELGKELFTYITLVELKDSVSLGRSHHGARTPVERGRFELETERNDQGRYVRGDWWESKPAAGAGAGRKVPLSSIEERTKTDELVRPIDGIESPF